MNDSLGAHSPAMRRLHEKTRRLAVAVLVAGAVALGTLEASAGDGGFAHAVRQALAAAVADGTAGDVTAVTAGDGLTGGATSGAATVNVVGGTGITASADAVGLTAGTAPAELAAITTAANGDLAIYGPAGWQQLPRPSTDGHVLTWRPGTHALGAGWEEGAAPSSWAAATFTHNLGVNATVAAVYQRIGDSGHYRVGIVLSGAPDTQALTLTMPSGHEIDSDKLPGAGIVWRVGTVGWRDDGARNYAGELFAATTTTVITLQTENGTFNTVPPFTMDSADKIMCDFSVPIVGW